MGQLAQFRGRDVVPLQVVGDVADPARAWRTQRERLHRWLASLPDLDWRRPTRCPAWDVNGLVRHLVSTTQFLGYSLHEGRHGRPTELLVDFDPHRTVEAAAASLGELSPAEARRALAAADATVDAELDALDGPGWSTLAEAPRGFSPPTWC